MSVDVSKATINVLYGPPDDEILISKATINALYGPVEELIVTKATINVLYGQKQPRRRYPLIESF